MTYNDLLKELSWQPIIKNPPVQKATHIVVGGMGGSALPADAMRFLDSSVSVSAHRDYGLPEVLPKDSLCVAISFSGNTEETLSFAHTALKQSLPLVIISSGGELLSFAEKNTLPFITVPKGEQPRNAMFFLLHSLIALLSFAGKQNLLEDFNAISFNEKNANETAQALANTLAGKLPIFYASRRNGFLTYMSKILMNETAKTPAFTNVFPELNHNEMQSFDTFAPEEVGKLSRFVFLRDSEDNPRIVRRMDVLKELFEKRNRSVTDIAISGATRMEKLVSTWFVMYLTARSMALVRNVDPDSVPMVEDFKKRL